MTQNGSESNYLQTLLQLGQTLNASLNLDQVLHVAIEQVVDFVRAERGFILLVDETTHRIEGKAVHNIDPAALEAALRGRDPANRPEISRTIVEQAVKEQIPIVSTNAMEDPRFGGSTSVRLASVRSVLCVPLLAQGKNLGIIYLDSRVRNAIFEDRHVEMVTAFANQAAVAIENARLYESLRRSLEEKSRLDRELQETETERLALEEANRLKSDYVGYVSHELRSPLTTIRGYVQTLKTDPDMDAQTRADFYETIEAEADRMLALINELLDSARLEAGRPLTLNTRPVQLAPLIERLARSLRFHKYWSENHRVKLEVGPLPEIEADEDKVAQILTNLLNNAVKYSPQGGPITLSARTEDGGIRVSVSDEGMGITAEHQAKLFTKFERLDGSHIDRIPGTGLGLYLTRHLVELHGGSITCESEPSRGTTFTVFLPARPPAIRD